MTRQEASRLVDALLVAAKVEREPGGNHSMARYYVGLADRLGDALDAAVPVPSGWGSEDYEEAG